MKMNLSGYKKKTGRLCILFLWLLIVSTLKAQEYPKPDWQYIDNPDLAGLDSEKLDKRREYLIDNTAFTGFIIVHKEKIVFEYGDVEENSYITSRRKSVPA